MSLQVAFPSLERLGETYDAIVVGAGPAGLATAIYLTRTNLKSLVLEAEKHGVYAAGDITCGRKFQIAVSVGQWVTAALSIIRSHVEARRKQKS